MHPKATSKEEKDERRTSKDLKSTTTGKSWTNLPFDPEQKPRAGRVSLQLHYPKAIKQKLKQKLKQY